MDPLRFVCFEPIAELQGLSALESQLPAELGHPEQEVLEFVGGAYLV